MKELDSRPAEAAVIGSMIVEPRCIGDVLGIILEADYFLYPEHKILFEVIFRLFISGQKIDGLLVRDELDRTGKLDEIGGVDYLRQVVESVPSAANAKYYAEAVLKHKQQRDIIAAGEQIQQVVNSGNSISEQVQEIQKIAIELTSDDEPGYYTLSETVDRVKGEALAGRKTHKTGFSSIDRIIEGFCPGELIILAARPSMGKSALALQIALNMARHNLNIVFFTLEMSHSQLIERALKQYSASELKQLNIVIHERADTPEKQIAFIKSRQHVRKIDAVFVDYLQLMTAGKSENRNQEISTISRKLKLAAMAENIPVVALSQLNRAVEARTDHKPRMSDLRESGSIEQDADIVMLLSREDYYRKSENPDSEQDGLAVLDIAKNRRGSTGIAQLVFLDEVVSFADKAGSGLLIGEGNYGSKTGGRSG